MASSAEPSGTKMATPPRQFFALPDGRRLSYYSYGTSGEPSRVMIFLHGVPASACEAAPLHPAAAAAGLKVLSVDRPGIGSSSPPPPGAQLSLKSFAADLGSIIDGLGLGPVALAGESGGGPYAAAAAALLGPSRVSQLLLISAVGGLAGKGALTLEDLADFDRWTMKCLQRHMSGIGWLLHRAAKWMAESKPLKLIDAAGGDLGPADRALLAERPEMGDLMVGFTRGAYEQGVGAVIEDYRALLGPWADHIDLSAISCRVDIWAGTEDKCVPATHAQWYADHIPHATLHTMDGEGHLTMTTRRGGELVAAVLEASSQT